MKWFMFVFSMLIFMGGCQKKQEPVKTMFSGNVGPNLPKVKLPSPAEVLKNAPPVIVSLDIEPKYPTIASTMHVSAQASDPEGDVVAFSYKWYVNNAEINDQTGDTLSCSSYKHNDVIHVVVTPSDGKLSGTSVVSSYIFIQNTPPVIESSPPSTIAGNRYSYQVKAVDIDNDPLTYKLESAPEGMVISNDGLITWEAGNIKLPVHTTIRIVVDDGNGGKSYQTYTISLEKKKL